MKVYVVTNCNQECSLTPEVFTTREKAVKALKESYDFYCTDEWFGPLVTSSKYYETHAEINYCDNCFNILDLYEINMEE